VSYIVTFCHFNWR